MAESHTPPAGSADAKKSKAPFEPPRFTAYGDIASLTQAVGRTGLSDGGKKTTIRTRP